MAVDFQERATLLSSQLLTDPDTTLSWKNQNINHHESCSESISRRPAGSCGSSSSSSGWSSPISSEFGSTEIESDEDDSIAELARQMADHMLQDDDEEDNTGLNRDFENSKSSDLFEKWSDCNSDSKQNHGQELVGATVKHTEVPAHVKNPNTAFYSNQGFTENQIRSIQFYQLKNEKHIKRQGSVGWARPANISESTQQPKPEQLQQKKQRHRMQNKGRACGFFGNGGRTGPLGSSQAGSGMRAIFLGGSGSRSGSCGTGVFLPRGTKNPSESRQKSGCSTVLIPARVLQALELHFNHMGALSQSKGCGGFNGYPITHDVEVARRNGLSSQQKQQSQPQVQSATNHQEMNLPQEWTY